MILKELITALNTNLRTVIPVVHYLSLPDESFLEKQSIVYTITNNNNESTLENPEFIKEFQITIRVNSAKVTKNTGNNEIEKLLNIVEPIKTKVYSINSNYTKCINEDQFFDPTLEVYTYVIIFSMFQD